MSVFLLVFFYCQMVTYLRLCLAHSAGLKPTLESSEQTQEQAPTLSQYIRSLFQSKSVDRNPVQAYVDFVRMIVTSLSGKCLAHHTLLIVAWNFLIILNH